MDTASAAPIIQCFCDNAIVNPRIALDCVRLAIRREASSRPVAELRQRVPARAVGGVCPAYSQGNASERIRLGQLPPALRTAILTRHLLPIGAAKSRRLKTLKGLTPYEFICKAWASQPERFTLDPLHQMPGPKS
jgi:hypothetical protein